MYFIGLFPPTRFHRAKSGKKEVRAPREASNLSFSNSLVRLTERLGESASAELLRLYSLCQRRGVENTETRCVMPKITLISSTCRATNNTVSSRDVFFFSSNLLRIASARVISPTSVRLYSLLTTWVAYCCVKKRSLYFFVKNVILIIIQTTEVVKLRDVAFPLHG